MALKSMYCYTHRQVIFYFHLVLCAYFYLIFQSFILQVSAVKIAQTDNIFKVAGNVGGINSKNYRRILLGAHNQKKQNIYSDNDNLKFSDKRTQFNKSLEKVKQDVLRLKAEEEDLLELIVDTQVELRKPCNNSASCHTDRPFLRSLLSNAKLESSRIHKELLQLRQEVKKKELNKTSHSVNSTSHRRHKRGAVAQKNKLWDNAVIPYVFDDVHTSSQRNLFRSAMRVWMKETCLVFKEKGPNDVNYLLFKPLPCGCCSDVGKKGGRQVISLGKKCYFRGIVIHELGHTIGYWHEHSRPDRDEYVTIKEDNIKPGLEWDFNKFTEYNINSRNEAYDYESIMHYSRNKFSKHPILDTIVPKQRGVHIGQNTRLSKGDIRQTNKLYSCPACGKTLMEGTGAIDHKTGPFGPAMTCQWRILAAHGERIQFRISNLGSLNCATDYVEVRDGHYAMSPSLGKYCNQENITAVVSSGNWMWIEYKTAPGSRAVGFRAEHKALCGGELGGSSGIFDSPHYPRMYPKNALCEWVITVRPGFKVLLTFGSYSIEIAGGSGECWDYIEVRDGPTQESKLIDKYCGSRFKPLVLVSTTNSLYVRFVSDDELSAGGFSASYSEETDECEGDDHGCEHTCINTVGSYKCTCQIGYELHSDGKACEKECGGLVELGRGTITSPSFPDHYPPNKHCVWQVKAPEGYTLTINFEVLAIEWDGAKCEFDYVRIFDVINSTLSPIGSYCGFEIPETITSRSNELNIEFQSDDSLQASGFTLDYVADEDECSTDNGGCQHKCENSLGSFQCTCNEGFTINPDGKTCTRGGCYENIKKPRGFISSPKYPRKYPSRLDCEWNFSTVPGHSIRLTFTFFDIEPNPTCRYDNVKIFDGFGTNSSLIDKYCGHEMPRPIVSTGQNLNLTFFSDAVVQRKGFRARHDTVCQTELKSERLPQKIVSHVLFGTIDYKNSLDCTWTFRAPIGKRVKLAFLTFDVEEETNCQYDFVDVYDGEEDNEIHHGRLCGTQLPSPIVSRSRRLRVHFHTDVTLKRSGFAFTHSIAE